MVEDSRYVLKERGEIAHPALLKDRVGILSCSMAASEIGETGNRRNG